MLPAMLLRVGFKNVFKFQTCHLFVSSGLGLQELCELVTPWHFPSSQARFGNQGTCNTPWEAGECQWLPDRFQPFHPESRDRAGGRNGWTCSGIILLAYFENKHNLNFLGMSIKGVAGGRRAADWLPAALELGAEGPYITPRRNRALPECRQNRSGQRDTWPTVLSQWPKADAEGGAEEQNKCVWGFLKVLFQDSKTFWVRYNFCAFGSPQLCPLTCPFPAWTSTDLQHPCFPAARGSTL